MVSPLHILVCTLALCASDAAFAVGQEAPASAAPFNHSITTAEARNNTVQVNGYLKYNKCHAWDNYNWDNAKFVCAWWHDTDFGSYANVFIKRYDGGFDKDCWCKEDMRMYSGSWGSRWTYSTDYEMVCYNRDGRSAASVRAEFDAVGCGDIPVVFWGPGI